MNVLSLFDGIGCGQLALNRAGIEYENYFASETDTNAISVSSQHYPNTIQIGDAQGVVASKLPKIDLLIGGSPCQGFSFAGKQLNFEDHRSKLFFEYVRLLEACKPRYFLLENVLMKTQFRDIISGYMGIEPTYMNSSWFSKQNRKRLYWTNIPFFGGVFGDNDNNFNRWLYQLGHGYIPDDIRFFKKYPSLTTGTPGTKYRIVVDLERAKTATREELRRNKCITRVASPDECEEFQTLPIGYTSMLPKTARYRAIGNGWTVDAIKYIFNGLGD